MDENMEKLYLRFRFTGDNEIGLTEFSEFLNNVNDYLNALKIDIDRSITLNLNVVAIEKGSFIVDLLPKMVFMASLIPGMVTTTKSFLSLVRDFLELKSFLKGHKPQSIEGKKVINIYGDVKEFNEVTLNVYDKNGETDKTLGRLVSALPDKRSLEITNNFDDKKFTIDDSNKLFLTVSDESLEELTRTSVHTKVSVIKPSLDMKSKWIVRWNDKIYVNITDENFKNMVIKKQISFCNGTELVVDLDIQQYLNIPDKKPMYTITKVYL